MSRYKKFKPLLILLFVSFLTGSVFCQDLEELMDLYAKQGHSERIGSPFNGVVLVAQNDEIIFKKAYGFYDHENNIPLKMNSRFMIGSITKQFTAMLIMQQVEKGSIELEKTVFDYLPYFPREKGEHLTIHRLLSHSAGLPHYEGLQALKIKRQDFFRSQFTPDEFAHLIAKVDFINEPGTEFHYSSLGYVLLGIVLEKVTEKAFATLLQENIVEPLGLRNTGYADNDYMENKVSKGYLFREFSGFKWLFSSEKGDYIEDDFRHQSTTFSTGGMHSTVADLWIWSQAIKQHKLLSPELTQKMLTPNIGGYCYGWVRNHETVIRRNPSVRVTSHGGALQGYRSHIAFYDDGTTIIFLSNVTPVNDLNLTQNIHLVANGIKLEDFRRDLLRPEIEEDLETFLEDGGIPAFREYYNEISRRAGYTVLPAQLAYVELMKLYVINGQEQLATKFVDELLSYYSRPDENIMNSIGYIFLEQEFYAKAIDNFRLNAKNYPYSPNVYDSLGEAYRENEQYQLALESFQKAVELAEETSDSRLSLIKENLASVNRVLSTR